MIRAVWEHVPFRRKPTPTLGYVVKYAEPSAWTYRQSEHFRKEGPAVRWAKRLAKRNPRLLIRVEKVE